MASNNNEPPDTTQGGTQIPAWLEAAQRRIRESPDVSPRNPQLTWQNNSADRIERQLQQDHHQTWGFVIYRTTYDSDTDWAGFLQRLRLYMEESFDFYNGRDILEKFTLTVLDDRAAFDGATTDTVRRHFQQWSLTAYPREQQYQGGIEALHAIMYDAPAPPALDVTMKGWVKVIDKSWYLGRDEGIHKHKAPIEGVTQNDVGWMKVRYQHLMPTFYAILHSWNNWSLYYRRPPEIVSP
ncbi:hypothetical protein OIDMADRAFT_51135 [Oidiodendron maius Zn]|uniref:Uncharacterized protein n=1 Tax=Oidiodendron maius (strain Zn) TaxID=913774 RepID=A0A0C3HQM6_OIDMZ|nr:hypothetical protein OIDMADRAFT_51135 [Oidiodendron maius Zn]